MRRPAVRAGLTATGAACAAAGAIYLVGRLVGVDFAVVNGDEVARVRFANVVVLTLVPMLVGTAVRAGLAGRTARPHRTFTIFVAVGTVLSFGTLLAEITWPDRLWLGSMHVAVAAVALAFLGRPLAGDLAHPSTPR